MESNKMGEIIVKMRKKKNMTQKQVGEIIGVTDKTISKWERGMGCPDISLLGGLAEVLGINVTEILSGEAVENENDGGNMKKTRFYVCKSCNNIIASTNEVLVNCCGSKLTELGAVDCKDNVEHSFEIERIEDEIYISLEHEMSKEHYISFVAYVTMDKLLIAKLYPEQAAGVRFKRLGHGTVYIYCVKDGLFSKRI